MTLEYLKQGAGLMLALFLAIFVLPWALVIQLLMVIGEYYQLRNEEKENESSRIS